MARGKYKRKRIRQQRRLTSVQESGLSERVIRVLEAHGVSTMCDLDMMSDEALSAMPRIGAKSLEEIHAVQMRDL